MGSIDPMETATLKTIRRQKSQTKKNVCVRLWLARELVENFTCVPHVPKLPLLPLPLPSPLSVQVSQTSTVFTLHDNVAQQRDTCRRRSSVCVVVGARRQRATSQSSQCGNGSLMVDFVSLTVGCTEFPLMAASDAKETMSRNAAATTDETELATALARR